MQQDNKLKNYQFLKKVVDGLRFSQGLYGRIFRDLLELEQDKTALQDFIDSLPEFKTTLDVVFFFEC